MKIIIRAMILGFLTITLISFFFGGQVSQQASLANYHKEAELIRTEQEQRNCKQVITSKACTAPTDRGARWICSKHLTDFNCAKHVDVGYLILDEHKKLQTQP